MSATILRFPGATTTDHYFGGCPYCGDSDGFLNIGREHWFRCDTHRTKWLAGANLFSMWREEDEDIWLRNRYRLSEFMQVQPVLRRHDGRGAP